MANIYESFLNRPDASALAPNASLHYITTTTSINESTAIIKHLQAQEKLIKKKSETVINTVASGNAIVLETETTLEFVRGGGAILPNMDDNMLVDSIVTIPFIHIVQLDSSGKISQIRLHWDQSTMLRQVDAIGRTGRNWPIRDGQAMAKLIKSSVSAAENGRKADPSKYNHFEFGHGEEAAPRDDFSTPPKFKAKPLKEHERHFGPGIDEDEPPSPAQRPVVHAPRPDADPHFAMTDAPSPATTRQPKPTRPDALASHLKSENGVLTAEEPSKKPLGSNTNSSNIRRGPDINSHYTSTDASPGVSNDENARRDDTRQAGRNAKSQGRAQNDHHFSLEDTPEKPKQIYKTAGDGMGGRKETSRSWMIGEEEAEPVKEAKIYKTYGNGMGGRRDAAPSWSWGDRDDEVEAETSNRKIYKTAGDGMGSRKARDEFSNEHGDEDFADTARPRQHATTTRKANELTSQAAQDGF